MLFMKVHELQLVSCAELIRVSVDLLISQRLDNTLGGPTHHIANRLLSTQILFETAFYIFDANALQGYMYMYVPNAVASCCTCYLQKQPHTLS